MLTRILSSVFVGLALTFLVIREPAFRADRAPARAIGNSSSCSPEKISHDQGVALQAEWNTLAQGLPKKTITVCGQPSVSLPAALEAMAREYDVPKFCSLLQSRSQNSSTLTDWLTQVYGDVASALRIQNLALRDQIWIHPPVGPDVDKLGLFSSRELSIIDDVVRIYPVGMLNRIHKPIDVYRYLDQPELKSNASSIASESNSISFGWNSFSTTRDDAIHLDANAYSYRGVAHEISHLYDRSGRSSGQDLGIQSGFSDYSKTSQDFISNRAQANSREDLAEMLAHLISPYSRDWGLNRVPQKYLWLQDHSTKLPDILPLPVGDREKYYRDILDHSQTKDLLEQAGAACLKSIDWAQFYPGESIDLERIYFCGKSSQCFPVANFFDRHPCRERVISEYAQKIEALWALGTNQNYCQMGGLAELEEWVTVSVKRQIYPILLASIPALSELGSRASTDPTLIKYLIPADRKSDNLMLKFSYINDPAVLPLIRKKIQSTADLQKSLGLDWKIDPLDPLSGF